MKHLPIFVLPVLPEKLFPGKSVRNVALPPVKTATAPP